MATPKKPEPPPDPPKRRQVNARLPDDIADALEAFIADQPVPPATSAVALIALRQYLQRAGYLKPGGAE